MTTVNELQVARLIKHESIENIRNRKCRSKEKKKDILRDNPSYAYTYEIPYYRKMSRQQKAAGKVKT